MSPPVPGRTFRVPAACTQRRRSVLFCTSFSQQRGAGGAAPGAANRGIRRVKRVRAPQHFGHRAAPPRHRGSNAHPTTAWSCLVGMMMLRCTGHRRPPLPGGGAALCARAPPQDRACVAGWAAAWWGGLGVRKRSYALCRVVGAISTIGRRHTWVEGARLGQKHQTTKQGGQPPPPPPFSTTFWLSRVRHELGGASPAQRWCTGRDASHRSWQDARTRGQTYAQRRRGWCTPVVLSSKARRRYD